MPDLQESEQLNELYRLYGVAAHNCCNIEYRIVNLLLGPKWKQTAGLTTEKVTEVYDKLQSTPLGSLLKEYKQHFSFTEQQIGLMENLLEKRNYLTHRFFGTYGKRMHDTAIQTQMAAELKELIILFQSVSRSLDTETWK
jgi:hypothetical protein